jgi:chromosome segregation ATPase
MEGTMMGGMRQTKGLRLIILMGAALMGMVGLTGCDYWPPALQAQIEQLRAEAQSAAAERAKLESQLMETAKLKDELQARVNELTQLNQELAGRNAALEKNLAEEKTKGAKVSGKASTKAAAKATAKPAAKTASKKKTTKKK